MASRTSLDSSAPIIAPSASANVRPRSQFNIFPAAATSPPSNTSTSPPSYTSPNGGLASPGSPNNGIGMASPPRNFSRPGTVHQKPMADILSQATPSTSTPSSNRQSTYGAQPNIFGTKAPQASTLNRSNTTASSASRQTLSSTTCQAEIKKFEEGLDKLENKKLTGQRYVPSASKEEGMQAFALGAKLERALERRLGGQDAVMRVRPRGDSVMSEKGSIAA